MLFGQNYSTPGPGVNKRDPNQSRISIFFEILFRKMWNLCKVNLAYILVAIPTLIITMVFVGVVTSSITDAAVPHIANMMKVAPADMGNEEFVRQVVRFDLIIRAIFAFLFMVFLGQGPFTAGLTYILRNYAREDHAWFFGDWWKHTKENFAQASIVFIIDIAVMCLLVTAFKVYMSLGGAMSFLAYFIAVIFLIYMIMHFYIYQLMITFKNSIKEIYRNAFVLAMQRLPLNLLMMLILLAVHIGLPILGINTGWQIGSWLIFFVAEGLILVAASGFMTNFFVYPQLEEYIKIQKSDDNS